MLRNIFNRAITTSNKLSRKQRNDKKLWRFYTTDSNNATNQKINLDNDKNNKSVGDSKDNSHRGNENKSENKSENDNINEEKMRNIIKEEVWGPLRIPIIIFNIYWLYQVLSGVGGYLYDTYFNKPYYKIKD